MDDDILNMLKRLRAIADTGLLYAKDDYDIERYEEIRELNTRLMGKYTGHEKKNLVKMFPAVTDYPTAKVDVRGLVLSPDRGILLVRERADGKWSLPGGWADIGFTPSETIIKEFEEETGLDVRPVRLLGVMDKKMHPHPPQPFYVYKMVFYCETLSGTLQKGFDVLDVGYFSINALPELSEDRILKSQIEMLYRKVISEDKVPYFD
ncbi:ADP-ribose pyrophosphatase YjhB, NUDIX family [Sinomicrobium oceani]|uniref:ADP-ribose pyrophosphatase YjhB, NUDIX family n=1 Tax=Sinomicrobium oceani TaxID=1150368 RepID=A0A1K1PPB1_9FLAO|nr:NUDIX hydrolase [Sinomicrobium oceani]SFW49479.1 ADP-ribose pyrophosphatase YjhB, NUDIX family [Sinomicrobium oceani]